jgi:hypothetical protein
MLAGTLSGLRRRPARHDFQASDVVAGSSIIGQLGGYALFASNPIYFVRAVSSSRYVKARVVVLGHRSSRISMK